MAVIGRQGHGRVRFEAQAFAGTSSVIRTAPGFYPSDAGIEALISSGPHAYAAFQNEGDGGITRDALRKVALRRAFPERDHEC